MGNHTLLIGLVVLALGINSCKTMQTSRLDNAATTQGHNSMNSLDWEGVYTGILPCADCEGIKTVIKLNSDLTYLMKTEYLGKSAETIKVKGTFSWNQSGNTIILNISNINARPSFYKVGENQLIQLDLKGNTITGDLSEKYILRKEI